MSFAYLVTFAQTCAIEFPFYFYFLRERFSLLETVVAVVALNALTHPLVFFGWMTASSGMLTNLLRAEAFAFSVEALACWYFLRLKPWRALGAATSANLASWQLGSMLSYFLWIRH